tara:strand:- start:462 stop:1841 length:1380 start_codon:yes stop_codon:yes gene_type:complete
MLDALPGGLDRKLLERLGFNAKVGQVQFLPSPDDRLLAAVGLGPAAGMSFEDLRQAGAALARAARKHRSIATDLVTVSDLERDRATRALIEGMALSLYRFDYKTVETSKVKDSLSRVILVGSTATGMKNTISEAVALVDGVILARNLVNEPGGSLTPPTFARRVARIAREKGLTVRVMDEAAIKRARLGGLLGVNRGSKHPPRFVELTYKPTGRATATIAFVGKGVTFDAGGLSIKPWQGMTDMKTDMGGAAAVVGAMSVLPSVAPTVRVRGYLPMTDNMLGGDATRPGDVLTIRNGKTIEVLNTDAEGRLILADALSLASEAKPDAIVDLATLTGACMVALGPDIAGLMGYNDEFLVQVEQAAQNAGERLWRLPLPEDYREMFSSKIADMQNIGGSYGGALTAGLILSEFVAEGIPWAHLDIAGPARSEKDNAEITEGGTGFGVRTLVELARSFETVT